MTPNVDINSMRAVSKAKVLPFDVTLRVRDGCLCLHLQRAARVVARRYDEALRPVGLTNGQFSLLISLNRPEAATMGAVAALLAMDRTTLTANLKPLERRRLLRITVDPDDRRGRRLELTPAGRELLMRALPLWASTHAALESIVDEADRLRSELRALGQKPQKTTARLVGAP